MAYLTASARTLTRAGRLPGQCQWHQLSPGGPSDRLGFILPMYYYLIITTGKWVDHSACRRTDEFGLGACTLSGA